MKQFSNSILFRSFFAVTVVFLIATQTVYAQTASEVSSKNDQEKKIIIESLLQRAYQRLAATEVDGVKKSQDVLIGHRHLANLLRALFEEETGKSSKTKESIGMTRFKQYLNNAAKDDPKKPIWDVFRAYSLAEYDEYYTKSSGEWKSAFDSKTDTQQQTQFRIEILNKQIGGVIDDARSKAESLRAEARDITRGINLAIASFKGDVAAVRALLTEGADINFKDDRGETPLMLASNKGHLPVVETLLAKGADVHAGNNNGDTALWYAAGKENSQIVLALLNKGADVNTKNEKGVTVLMKASILGHLAVVQTLVAKGANVCEKANRSYTAWDFAINRHPNVAQFLEQEMDRRCPLK